MSEDSSGAGRFFGRRKGKSLRTGHDRLVREVLPRLRVPLAADRSLDLASLFPEAVSEFHLEIGFGGGEHLLATARAGRGIGFLGCEPFVNGMAKALAAIETEGLGNIRLWDDDASALIAAIPDAGLARASILFPDPWPKRRQRKRRFVSDEGLAALARVLRPGAELRFATDIDDYAGWTLARVIRSPHFRWNATSADDWRNSWAGWAGTRYEAKAKAAGRSASYLTFIRV